MSLETLLEAAEFVELKHHGSAKSRGLELKKFHQYAKSGPPPLRDRKRKSESFGRSGNDDDDSNDRQKSDDSWVANRDVHNKLEKHRRAQMKDCFENLKRHIPGFEEKKASSLAILRSGVRHIQALKKREKELQQHLQSLSNRKSLLLERARRVKSDLAEMGIEMNVPELPQQSDDDEDTRSASTATAEGDDPFVSDDEHEQHMLWGFPKLANQETNMSGVETASSRMDGETHKASLLPVVLDSVNKPQSRAPMNSIVTPTKTTVNHILQQTIVKRSLQQHVVADKLPIVSDKHQPSSSSLIGGQQKNSPQVHLQSTTALHSQHYLQQSSLLNTSGSKQNLQLIISPDVLQQLLVQQANSKSANTSELNTLAQLLPSLASNSTMTPKKDKDATAQRYNNSNGASHSSSSSSSVAKVLLAQDSSSSSSSGDSMKSTSSFDGPASKPLVMPSIRQAVLPTPGSQLLTPLQLAQVAPVLFAQSQHSHLAQGVTMRQVNQVMSPIVTQAQKVSVQPAMIALSGAQILSPLTFVAPGLQVISGFQQSGLMAGLTNSVSATTVSLPSNILQQASVIPILNHAAQTLPVVQSPVNLQSGQQQFIVVSLPNAIGNSSLATVINSGNVNLS